MDDPLHVTMQACQLLHGRINPLIEEYTAETDAAFIESCNMTDNASSQTNNVDDTACTCVMPDAPRGIHSAAAGLDVLHSVSGFNSCTNKGTGVQQDIATSTAS